MKRVFIVLTAGLLGASALSARAADVGVSISIGQPGFYGRIDIGGAPPPVLINPAPVVIERAPVGVVVEPMYLYVPPGHQKNWGRYCHQYNACGHPVYFVKESWYNNVYVPHYRTHHVEAERAREHERDHHEDRGKEHRND